MEQEREIRCPGCGGAVSVVVSVRALDGGVMAAAREAKRRRKAGEGMALRRCVKCGVAEAVWGETRSGCLHY